MILIRLSLPCSPGAKALLHASNALEEKRIKETLDYYGICYSEKMVYPKGKDVSFPKCCIVYADVGFKLWYEGRYYGSEAAEQSQIVSYLEIAVQQSRE